MSNLTMPLSEFEAIVRSLVLPDDFMWAEFSYSQPEFDSEHVIYRAVLVNKSWVYPRRYNDIAVADVELNAANAAKDFGWLQTRLDAAIRDVRDYAQRREQEP